MKTHKQLKDGVIQPNGTDKIKVEGDLKDACWKGYEAIGTKKKNGREVPNCVPVKEEEDLDEAVKLGSKVTIHAPGKSYHGLSGTVGEIRHGKFKGAPKTYTIDHEGGSTQLDKKNIKLHKEDISESDAAYAAALEKQKENMLTKKDQGTMQKIRDLMAKEKAKKMANEEKKEDLPFDPDAPKKNPAAKAGKYGLGYSVAKHLAKQGMKKLTKEGAEADKHWDEAEKHLKAAKKHKEGSEEYHGHMSAHHEKKADWHAARGRHDSADREAEKAEAHHQKFLSAMKGVKEDIEQIDELSKDTLQSYIHKSFAQGNDLHYDLAHSRGNKATDAERKALRDKISKRNTGIIKAGKKLREGLSMLSLKDFVKEDYVSHAQRKAVWASRNEAEGKKKVKEEVELDEAMTPMQKLKDALDRHSEKAVAANKAGDHEAVKVHQGYMNKIKTKMGKLAKNEEIDLTEMEELCEISKSTLGSYVKKAADDYSKRDTRISHALDRNLLDPNVDKAVAKQDKRKAGMHKAIDKLTKEEVEELDEISKSTLASYIPKAAKSARYSGQIATDFEKRADSARKGSTKNSWKNLATKYKKKAWDREDNIAKAANLLAKEEVEQIDENDIESKRRASINAINQGHPRTTGQKILSKLTGGRVDAKTKTDPETGKKYHDITLVKNKKGPSDRPVGKPVTAGKSSFQLRVKEEKEETMVSYKDFVAALNEELKGNQHKLDKNKNGKLDAHDFKLLRKEEEEIEEGKIDDLKDRMAAKKATQSAYDKDYKPAAKSNVQKVKGHSYGAGEEEGEDDDDNSKVIKKPSEPVVKRGRGRPAGSKSGARN